jgi:hypothetical protein
MVIYVVATDTRPILPSVKVAKRRFLENQLKKLTKFFKEEIMKLPKSKSLINGKRYRLIFDIKSLFTIGIVFSQDFRFIVMLFGFTLHKERSGGRKI